MSMNALIDVGKNTTKEKETYLYLADTNMKDAYITTERMAAIATVT